MAIVAYRASCLVMHGRNRGGGDASPTIWKMGDISNVPPPPRFWGPERGHFVFFFLLACLSERLVMYTRIPLTPCLENWPTNFEEGKKCRSPPPPPPPRHFQAWHESSNVSPTFEKGFPPMCLVLGWGGGGGDWIYHVISPTVNFFFWSIFSWSWAFSPQRFVNSLLSCSFYHQPPTNFKVT